MLNTKNIPAIRIGAPHKDIVKHYVLFRRPILHKELEWFSQKESFSLALKEAVCAKDQWGKRLSHQRRLLQHVIPDSLELLQSEAKGLKNSKTFDELFGKIETALNTVFSAGDLYKYDTALRLGAFLGIYPTRVFLQTGALSGAKKLSRSLNQRSMPLTFFPEPFHSIAPFEMENLLCCYKEELLP